MSISLLSLVVLKYLFHSLIKATLICVHYVWVYANGVCAHMGLYMHVHTYRDHSRTLDILLHHSLPYHVEAGCLPEPGVKLAGNEPQWSAWSHSTGVTGEYVTLSSLLCGVCRLGFRSSWVCSKFLSIEPSPQPLLCILENENPLLCSSSHSIVWLCVKPWDKTTFLHGQRCGRMW